MHAQLGDAVFGLPSKSQNACIEPSLMAVGIYKRLSVDTLNAAVHPAPYLCSFFANCGSAHLAMSGVDVPVGTKLSIGKPLYSRMGTPLMKSSAVSKLQVTHTVTPPYPSVSDQICRGHSHAYTRCNTWPSLTLRTGEMTYLLRSKGKWSLPSTRCETCIRSSLPCITRSMS